MNVTKTKEMPLILDINPYHHKYLGTAIKSKLCFDKNNEVLCQKGWQHSFCFRKLRSFNVDKTLMTMFYTFLIQSVFSFVGSEIYV